VLHDKQETGLGPPMGSREDQALISGQGSGSEITAIF